MASAFDKPTGSRFGSAKQNESWLKEFWFRDGMQLPIQVLNPPEEMFADGFPVIRRHWAQRPVVDKDGNPVIENGKSKMKWLKPMPCTSGHATTDGNCLVCFAKERDLLTADRGQQTPNEEMIIPIYEHTLYRKVGDKYEPVPPGMPLIDNSQQQVFEGGLKIMYIGDSQFRKLRTQNDNVANQCSDCSKPMQMESLNCRHCESPLFEAEDLAMLSNDELDGLRYKETECAVCNATDSLDLIRVCGGCGGHTPKTLHDIVVMAGRASVPAQNGKTRKEYTFENAAGYELKQPDEEALAKFWADLKNLVDNPPSIQRQWETLQIQPPAEWLQKSNTSAHAQKTQSYDS